MFENLKIRNLRIGRFRLFRNKAVNKFYSDIKSWVRDSKHPKIYRSDVFWKLIDKELAELDGLDIISSDQQISGVSTVGYPYSEEFNFVFRCTLPLDKHDCQDSNAPIKKEYLWNFALDENDQVRLCKAVVTFQIDDFLSGFETTLNNDRLAFGVSTRRIVYDRDGLEIFGSCYDDSSQFLCLPGKRADYLDSRHQKMFDSEFRMNSDCNYNDGAPRWEIYKFFPEFDYKNQEEFNADSNCILGTYIPIYHSNPNITLFKTHKTNPNIRYVRTCKLEETGWKETIEIYEGENKIAYFNGKKWIPCDTENTTNLDEIVKVFSL